MSSIKSIVNNLYSWIKEINIYILRMFKNNLFNDMKITVILWEDSVSMLFVELYSSGVLIYSSLLGVSDLLSS